MKKYNTRLVREVIVLIIFAVGFFSALKAQNEEAETRISDHIKYLSSDELEGRFPGTEGARKAMDYMKSKFMEYGLKPVTGNYTQEFSMVTGLKFGDSNSLYFEQIVNRPGVPREQLKWMKQNWELSKDFVPLSFSDNREVSGDIAFVGYGISAPDIGYDDYAGIDVKDKIVIFISETPDGDNKESKFHRYADMRFKAKTARDKGAVGVIMVKMMGDSMNVFERPEYSYVKGSSGIVIVQAQRQSLGKFFPRRESLIDLDKDIIKNKKPHSILLPDVRVTIKTDIQQVPVKAYNVCGMVEGTDSKLKDEYVIVGAHYDHLGWGGALSMYHGKVPMIHNGADDNASGSAALLEMAKMTAQNPMPRSVIFLSFSGEEEGLLGSNYFVNHPLVDMSKVTAMINLDMVGRMHDNKLTVFGLGTSPTFPQIVDSIAGLDSLNVIRAADGYGPSDHASFYKTGIPVLMFFTGLHDDYHRPTDDFEKINIPGEYKTVVMAETATRAIAAMIPKPQFTTVAAKENENREGERSYGKVWFGIVPSFEESPLGCRISGTSAGSPAEKAGMKSDDIIVAMDGVPVRNLYDFMYSLKGHNAGDVISVDVIRGTNKDKVNVQVKLAERNK